MLIGPVCSADDGHKEFADQHAKGPPDQDGATTESLNNIKGEGCGANVDKGGDQADEEGVADGV